MKMLLKFLIGKREIVQPGFIRSGPEATSSTRRRRAGLSRCRQQTPEPDAPPLPGPGRSPPAATCSVWPHTAGGGVSPPSPEFRTRHPGTAELFTLGWPVAARPPRGLAFPAEPQRGPVPRVACVAGRHGVAVPLGTVSDTLSVQRHTI